MESTLGLTHLMLILPLVLILGWTYGYDENGGGLGKSGVPLFFWHPTLMVFAYCCCMGEAMISWRAWNVSRKWQKNIHAILQTLSVASGLAGLIVVFRFHDEIQAPNLYSVHSWLGIVTYALALMQWLVSVFVFWIPGMASGELKSRIMPLHQSGGKMIFGLAISAMATGIMQRQSFLRGKSEKYDGVNMYGNALAVLLVMGCACAFWVIDTVAMKRDTSEERLCQ